MCESEAAHAQDPEIAWISFKKKICLDHKFITSLVCHRKKDFVGLIRHSVQQRAWGQGCKYLMVFSGQMINSDGIAALVYFSFTNNYMKCILIHLIKFFIDSVTQNIFNLHH